MGKRGFRLFRLKQARPRIAVNEKLTQRKMDAIVKDTRAGRIVDGKIFIVALPECL